MVMDVTLSDARELVDAPADVVMAVTADAV